MKQQTLCVLSLFLIGCGSSPAESSDKSRHLPQVPPAPQVPIPNQEDEEKDKPKLYNETGALPSTKADWERVGVYELTDEEILALAAKQKDKPRLYNETGALPSTKADWERVGVPEFSSANLSKEEIEQVIRGAKQQLEQKKASKSIVPTDSSGSTSALAALKGKSGVDATQLMVNGVSGSHIDFGLPMYVQLMGSADHGKSTAGMMGLVAYKLGNSVLGVIQSYANSGTGFNADSRHLESSIVAAHSFGLVFVEGQLGSVSASDVNFKDWSGLRSQVRFGVDTPFGAPFVQLTHRRDFGSTSDTAGYVGFEIATTEFKADTYSFSTSLLTKVGHHSIHRTTGSIDWTAALNLNSGVAFNTNLTLGSALESKAAFNLSLDR